MTGSKRVADAASDGYTFVLGTVGTHAQGQSLYKKPLYNAAIDFSPVALIAEVPIVLITRKDLPVSNLKEFIAYAKANQSKMPKIAAVNRASMFHPREPRRSALLVNPTNPNALSETTDVQAAARASMGDLTKICCQTAHRSGSSAFIYPKQW